MITLIVEGEGFSFMVIKIFLHVNFCYRWGGGGGGGGGGGATSSS